jgi:hypothetical protein
VKARREAGGSPLEVTQTDCKAAVKKLEEAASELFARGLKEAVKQAGWESVDRVSTSRVACSPLVFTPVRLCWWSSGFPDG